MVRLINLLHDYFDRPDVVVYLDEYYFIQNIDRIADENNIIVSDKDVLRLVEMLMNEY